MRGGVFRRGPTWSYRLDVGLQPNGRRKQQVRGGFRTRRAAEAALADVLANLNSGAYGVPTKMAFGAYLLGEWLPSIKGRVRASTLLGYERSVTLHVIPHLGELSLSGLRPSHLNGLYATLLEGDRACGTRPLGAKSVRNVHGVVSKSLADAVDCGLVATNVAVRAKPPSIRANGARAMQVWDAQELRTFLDFVAEDRLYTAWVVAAHTGARRGEILGLRWSDVDLELGQLSISRALVSVNYEMQLTDTKTSTGARTIALNETTVTALRAHRERQEQERAAWAEAHVDTGVVFAREDGTPIHPDRFTQMFHVLVRRARLPRIRLHDLRHTHGSLLLKAGVPVKVVSERLGHASPAFTMTVYQHILPGMQQAAAQRFDELLTS